jgi:hypothetical protein
MSITTILNKKYNSQSSRQWWVCRRTPTDHESKRFMDFTRFNRHLLRSKLNWRISHEESQIPGAIQS